MRLLILGGTVFLSRATAEEAVHRGHEVTCACRGTGPLPEGVRHLRFDRSTDDPAQVLGPVASEVDAVVDVARRHSWVAPAVAAVPDAHWVFVSTISVYADNHTLNGSPETLPVLDPITEDADLGSGPDVYGGMKVACEEAVTTGAASSTVVRPGLIVGPGDPSGRFTYWVHRLAGDGPVLAPGSPEDIVQLIDVRDLAAWLVTLAEDRRTGVFDAIAPQLTRADFLAEVARGVGTRPDLRWVDSERLVELGVEEWMGPGSIPLWLASEEYAGMLAHDAGPAAAAGFRPRLVSDSAADTLEWLRQDRDAVRTGLTRDEEQQLLARL